MEKFQHKVQEKKIEWTSENIASERENNNNVFLFLFFYKHKNGKTSEKLNFFY